MDPQLGKIQKVKFGHGGYDDAMIGFSFTLGGESWAVGDFWGSWRSDPTEHTKWTKASRANLLGDYMMRFNQLLEDSKSHDISELVGIPVRVYFKNFNELDRWEILKEVL